MFSASTHAEIIAQLPSSTRLIAVTKKKAIADIEAAYAAGIRDFAESRIQEALPKLEALASLSDITWHFIGHIQTNKARKVLEHFKWIHSVDSLSLAQRLDRIAGELGLAPQGLLQVKLLPDENKYGWTPPQLEEELPSLMGLKHLALSGLMTILPLGLSTEEKLTAFQKTAHFKSQLQQSFSLPLPEISMGMSGDYPQAVAAGSTMIRLGTILFGDRH